MRKVYKDIKNVIELFISQSQHEAMTPLVDIEGRGKGRRLFFEGDTIYSYGKHFPLARIDGTKIYVNHKKYSKTTQKHKRHLEEISRLYRIQIIQSDDLKNPMLIDEKIEEILKDVMLARKRVNWSTSALKMWINSIYPITKSKFTLLFDKEHEKLRGMLFSDDIETINLAKKIIKQQKLI